MTPDDTITRRLEMSHRSGSASSARRITDDRGRVDGVPLDAVEELGGIEVTPLECGDAAADHQVADRVEHPRAVHQRRGGQVARPWFDDPVAGRVEVLFGRHAALVGRVERAEHVVLAPHDALRHPGRTAGVQEDQVVARPSPRARHVVVGAVERGVLVGHRPLGARAAAVVDPEPAPDLGDARPNALAVPGERAVEHDGGGVGVVPQVDEFVVGVAVVGVDRGVSGLEGGERRLHVLGAVVEVERDLVLLGDAVDVEQCGGDAVCAAVEIGPRVRAVTLLLSQRVGKSFADRLPQVGEVPAVGCGHSRVHRRRKVPADR
jgi:hypothetical protein